METHFSTETKNPPYCYNGTSSFSLFGGISDDHWKVITHFAQK